MTNQMESHPPLGPPRSNGPDVSTGHVQYELMEICCRMPFYKSQLNSDPAEAHSGHPEMGGLDWLFRSGPFLLSSSGWSFRAGSRAAALWCFLSFQAANVLKQHSIITWH